MNRAMLAAGLAAVAFFVSGCGDEGAGGLQDLLEPDSRTQPVEVLVLTALAFPGMAGLIPEPLVEAGILPEGSRVDTLSLLDPSKQLVVPSPEFLGRHDAVLVFTDSWPAGQWGPGTHPYDTIGGLLADYSDAGGGLVVCQFAVSGLGAGIRGRLVSPGYAPLREGYLETHVDLQPDRSLVRDSIELPLHPIFRGIDLGRLILPTFRWATGHPDLDATAVLLAVDDRGTNAIAVNSSGTIVCLNMHFEAFAFPEDYPETIRLFANALLFVSGRTRE